MPIAGSQYGVGCAHVVSDVHALPLTLPSLPGCVVGESVVAGDEL